MKRDNKKAKAVQLMLNATLEEYLLYLKRLTLQSK